MSLTGWGYFQETESYFIHANINVLNTGEKSSQFNRQREQSVGLKTVLPSMDGISGHFKNRPRPRSWTCSKKLVQKSLGELTNIIGQWTNVISQMHQPNWYFDQLPSQDKKIWTNLNWSNGLTYVFCVGANQWIFHTFNWDLISSNMTSLSIDRQYSANCINVI
jgi:hypothetical protein